MTLTGVPFISIEGSGFRAMFVGIDVSKDKMVLQRLKVLKPRLGISLHALEILEEVDLASIHLNRGATPDDPGLLRADAAGELTISRLDYGVGQGDWASTKTVGEEVVIRIEIRATRPR